MPKFNPLVSIVIPVYNGSNYMKEAIDSALGQTYKNIEVIVVNDGSTDNTDEIAKSYGDKIRYFKKRNGGVATALNKAIKEAKGEYISWLSHDDVYVPEKIEKQVGVLKKNQAEVVYSNVIFVDNKGETIRTSEFESDASKKLLSETLYPIYNGAVNGCSTLISNKAIKSNGGFDTELKMANDYDMWLKLFRSSKVVFQKEALVKYRVHDSQSTTTSKEYLSESNKLWKRLISDISDKEILEFNTTTAEFYLDMSLRMSNSGFTDASSLAQKLFLEAVQSETNERQRYDLLVTVFSTLMEKEARVQEQHRVMKLKTAKIDSLEKRLKNTKAKLKSIEESKKYRLLVSLTDKLNKLKKPLR